MPVVKEPVEQRPFERSMVSVEMERLFRHILQLPGYDPAHLDDAADVMDYDLSDSQLAEICQAPAGPHVPNNCPSLRYSSELRKRLFDELTEIEMSLDQEHEGWLDDLLEGDE